MKGGGRRCVEPGSAESFNIYHKRPQSFPDYSSYLQKNGQQVFERELQRLQTRRGSLAGCEAEEVWQILNFADRVLQPLEIASSG